MLSQLENELKRKNEESKNYRQMLDKEYAQNIAKRADLGIARSIQEQFGKHLKDQ